LPLYSPQGRVLQRRRRSDGPASGPAPVREAGGCSAATFRQADDGPVRDRHHRVNSRRQRYADRPCCRRRRGATRSRPAPPRSGGCGGAFTPHHRAGPDRRRTRPAPTLDRPPAPSRAHPPRSPADRYGGAPTNCDPIGVDRTRLKDTHNEHRPQAAPRWRTGPRRGLRPTRSGRAWWGAWLPGP